MSRTIISPKASSPHVRAEAPTRLGKLRYFLKKHLPLKKKVKAYGSLRKVNGWTEEELREIVHMIGKKCPGVTSIHVVGNELSFTFECTPEEFLGKKRTKGLDNPSKRKGKEDSKDGPCKRCTP